MQNLDVAITVQAPPNIQPRLSEDFELVRYPTHPPSDWQPSHRQEELPYYMTDDTSARRRVPHHPQGPTTPVHNTGWANDDGEGKDVYAKANAFQRYGSGGWPARRAPPPPPTSFVRSVHAACSVPQPCSPFPYTPAT
jgi:hypothetical protein